MPTRGTKLTAFNLHAAWFYGKYNRLRDKRQKLGSGGVNYAAARLDPIVLPGFYWHSLRDLHLAKSKRRHGNAICCISETFNRLRTKGGGGIQFTVLEQMSIVPSRIGQLVKRFR